MRYLGFSGASLLAALLCGSASMAAQQSQPPTDSALSLAAQKYFTDVPLVTQDGREVRFYTDLIKGKVVVINMFFGTCQGICPKSSEMLSRLQELLGDRLGKDVFLLSFSEDPDTDTPEKLKAYGEEFHSRPGWLFLTGKKANVDLALHKLGEKAERKEDHLTLLMIGNDKTGLWKKVLANGLTADQLMTLVDSVVHDQE